MSEVAQESDWEDVPSEPQTQASESDWVDVEAPNNSVFHEPTGRVLDLPQGMDARETQYTIDKDVDGKKGFYGQVHVGELPPLDPALLPEIPKPMDLKSSWAGILTRSLGRGGTLAGREMVAQTQLTRAARMKAGKTTAYEQEYPGVENNPAYQVVKFFMDEDTPEEKAAVIDAGVRMEEKAQASLKRLRDDVKRYGFDTTADETDTFKKILAGVGESSAEYSVVAGASFLTRNPVPATAYFYTKQRGASFEEAYVKTGDVDKSERIANEVAIPVSALDIIGLGNAFKAAKGAGVFTRIWDGIKHEFPTEGVQSLWESGVTNVEGIRNDTLGQVFESAFIEAAAGGVVGAGANVAFGARIAQSAVEQGVPEDIAVRMGKLGKKYEPAFYDAMGDFIEREVSPLSSSDESAKKFMQLMQRFDAGKPVREGTVFTPEEEEVFKKWVDIFDKSAPDDRSADAVEASWFKMATSKGLDSEQAVTSAKLIGAFSKFAGNALGIRPMDWYESNNLDLEVQRTPEQAVSAYKEKLDALKLDLPDAPLPERVAPQPTAEDEAIKAEEIAGFEKRLSDARSSTKDVGMKKPIINYLKGLGGIRTDGLIYSELRHLGIDRKTAFGLFNNKDTALRDIDNIPVEEFNRALGVSAQDDGNGYVDRDWLLEALRDEQFGKRMGQEKPAVDDSFIQALDKAGLDYRTATAEQVYEALGADADIVTAAADMGVELMPKEVRQIRAIMDTDPAMDVRDAIDEFAERSAIMGDRLFQRDGNQAVIPGAEKATDKQVAEKGMEGRMKATKAQKPMDEGMFGDGFKQGTLFQRYERMDLLQRMFENDLRDRLETLMGYKGEAHAAKRDAFVERARTGTLTEADLALKKDVVEAAKRVGGKMFQSAFHGSPYHFDKFTTDRIGSGEGNQAFGWGLYFAGRRKVAEYYRESLSDRSDSHNRVQYKGIELEKGSPEHHAARLLYHNKKPDMVRLSKEMLTDALQNEAYAVDTARQAGLDTKEYYRRLHEFIKGSSKKDIVMGKGQLYEVQLPEDDELLHWDKKIEAQPPIVKQKLKDSGIWKEMKDNLSDYSSPQNTRGALRGENIYAYLQWKLGSDKAASMRLNELGIQGMKYPGGTIANSQSSGYNYVIFDDNAVKIKNTFYQEGARGSITFGRDRTLIELFQQANPSTLLHELGHFFLRDMAKVAASSRRPTVKRDFELVKKWLGTKDGKFTEAQEEKFARGFEAYLREGKAPVEGLQGVFDRFKAWLTGIYKSAKDLNVEINDDVRQVFDRMLGAEYSKAESAVKERGQDKLAKDYEAVKAPPPPSLRGDTGDILASAGQLVSNIFTPISSRLGRIDPKLKAAVRKYTFNTGMAEQRDRERVVPFLNAVEKMTDEDYRILDFALKNRDNAMVDQMVDKYGMRKEFGAVRELLDDIYNTALEVGLDVAYLDDYFPRMVKLNKATDYMSQLRGRPDWSLIQEALAAEDPMNQFTDEEKAVFVNKWLRGFTAAATQLTKPSFTKERVIDYVEPQNNHFYLESGEALLKYISAMRLGIAQREIFGKGQTSDESIGAYVANLVESGAIDYTQENEVKLVMQALLNAKGPGIFVSWLKNAGYVYLMGSPISAITQIGDLAFSLAKNGYYNTGVSLTKAIVGKSVLKKEDLGIDNIAQEFEDKTRSSEAVRKVFKVVGLSWMDNIGKQTFIESSYKRLREEAKKNSSAYQKKMDVIFGDEAASVRQDLLDGTISDNVKLLLYSEMSDVQPVSLAEMPVGYLRGGNWRSLYMLKTYTIKQLDIYRREIFDKMATGELEQVKEGTVMMIRLATALMLTGMGADALKDLILGRAMTLSDTFMDNLIKLSGLTKFQIYKSRRDGVGNTLAQTMFIPPLYAPFDNLIKDVQDISSGKIKAKDAQSLNYVPVVGKFYYWWVGGGRAKEDKKQGKKNEK